MRRQPELQLVPAGKAWYDSIRLRVKDGLGAEKQWSYSLAALVLHARWWMTVEWMLDESEAASLPATLRVTEAAEPSEAVVLMDKLLLKQPGSVRALQLRAELAEKEGDIHRAFLFANRALTAARKAYSGPGQELLSLILLRDRLYWRLLEVARREWTGQNTHIRGH